MFMLKCLPEPSIPVCKLAYVYFKLGCNVLCKLERRSCDQFMLGIKEMYLNKYLLADSLLSLRRVTCLAV